MHLDLIPQQKLQCHVLSTKGGVVGETNSETSPESLSIREQLILEHMPLVRLVARVIAKRLPQHIEMDDLISAGTVGLLEAAERFEQSKHAQFGTFAQFRIRGAILDSLRSLDWSPRVLRRQSRMIAKAIGALAQTLGRTPTELEVAVELGMDLATYQQTLGQIEALQVEDLYAGTDEETDGVYLDLPAPAASDPLALCIQGQTREQLSAALQDLSERERLVLTLLCYEGMTMREVGLTLGVVESRVSQIKSLALKRLQRLLLISEQKVPVHSKSVARKPVEK